MGRKRVRAASAAVAADFDPLDAARHFFGERDGTERVWLVGGRVRDGLLGRKSLDTDLAVEGGALSLASELAAETGGSFVALDRERDIARVVWAIDSQSNSEGRAGLDARERAVDLKSLEDGDLAADLAARDLTVNALAIPLRASELMSRADVIDHHGGLRDLETRLIRMISPAAFDADPIRLLRAPRLAAELGFEIENATEAAIRHRAIRAAEPAGERIRDEVLRLMAVSTPATSIRSLMDLGLLNAVLPELARSADKPFERRGGASGLETALAALDASVALETRVVETSDDHDASEKRPSSSIDRNRDVLANHLAELAFEGRPKSLWIRLAVLVAVAARSAESRYDHRLGSWIRRPNPRVYRVLALRVSERLRLSGAAAEWMGSIAAFADDGERIAHDTVGVGERVRLIQALDRKSGNKGIDIALVALALEVRSPGLVSKSDQSIDEHHLTTLEEFVQAELRRRDADETDLLDGRTLMEALDLKPGPIIGRLLDRISIERAGGEIKDRESALRLAARLLIAEKANV